MRMWYIRNVVIIPGAQENRHYENTEGNCYDEATTVVTPKLS